MNYDWEVFTRENRTPAGTFDCYELLNRHGADPMLAEMDNWCGPDGVLYDIGANVGIYAVALTVDRPRRRVLAFEPNLTVVEQLCANVRVNDLQEQIRIHNAGIGSKSGRRPFYRSTYPELSSFDRESATRWGASVRAVVDVEMRDLDSVVCQSPSPDVVKVDVEGAAPDVIEGATRTLQYAEPVLFVEVHEDGIEEGTGLRKRLHDHGYNIAERETYWRCEPGH